MSIGKLNDSRHILDMDGTPVKSWFVEQFLVGRHAYAYAGKTCLDLLTTEEYVAREYMKISGDSLE